MQRLIRFVINFETAKALGLHFRRTCSRFRDEVTNERRGSACYVTARRLRLGTILATGRPDPENDWNSLVAAFAVPRPSLLATPR